MLRNRIEKDMKQYGPGILAAVMVYFLVHELFGAFCPSLLITGFPCPGCGMTRAVICLLSGQFRRSWALNPAAVFWVIWFLMFAFNRYIKGKKSKFLSRAAWGIMVFMVIAYAVRMKMYFPNKPPYVYAGNNLFSKTVPGYAETVKYLLGR